MQRTGEKVVASAETWLAVADAAYDLDIDDETWLTRVLEAARPALDHGGFVHGWLFRVSERGPVATSVIRHPEHEHREALRIVSSNLPPDPRDLGMPMHRIPLAMTASEFFGDAAPGTKAGVPPALGRDSVGLTAFDTSGLACTLIGTSQSSLTVTPRTRAAWRKVAAHLATAMRLRARVRAFPEEASLEAAEALFDARKRLVHAGKPVEDKLALVRAAAEHFSRRTNGDDPARALALWRALVAGTWSFVETIDTDGKRFFALRRNEPRTPGPPLLDERERTLAGLLAMGSSNKAIAYQLGVAESTVSRAVVRLCTKLGVPSRGVLLELLSTFAAQARA